MKTISLADLRFLIRDNPVFEDVKTDFSAPAFFTPSLDWLVKEHAPLVLSEFERRRPRNGAWDCTQAVRLSLLLADEANAMRNSPDPVGMAMGHCTGLLLETLNGMVVNPMKPLVHDTCLLVANDGNFYFYEPQTGLYTLVSEVGPLDFLAESVQF